MERPRKNFKPHNFNNFSNFTRKPKKKFEQRENTIIGERGINISGG